MRNLAEAPERSIVSVLVVDTVNSTGHIAGDDPDDAQELLDRIYDHLNGAVKRAGGLFLNFSGDGGVAVFGWPDSLEDHADRACEAAWLIQQPALEAQPIRDSLKQPIRFRVGIHSGLIGLRRMDMDIGARLDPVGGTVHIAANLQKIAAPDGTLVSSKTLELCRSEQVVTPHDDLPSLTHIKAKTYLLTPRAHQLSARTAPRPQRSLLVGRLDEREILRDVLVRRGDVGRAAAIVGEPGIGKSRLAATAIEDAQASGLSVLVFRGDSRKRTTPYSAMRSLIFDALSLNEFASDDEVIRALNDAGVDILDDGPLGVVMLSRRDEADSTSSGVTQTQVSRALVETLVTLAGGTSKLIVVEDLHLVDLESIYCLQLLATEKASGAMTLLVTGRPESMADAQRIAGTVLHLDLLPRDEMRDLARQLWPSGVPQTVMEKVLDRADGVPFVLEQIILSISSDSADNIDLAPQSVQSVIHARLNRLSASAKTCAQALSVLGDEVELDIALRVLDTDTETLQRDRLELERLEIIHPSTAPSLRFRHTIVAEACSETLPGARRRDLHRAAITAITHLYDDPGAQYERLAFHAEGARDDEKALEYLWLAGLRARRSSANESLFLIFQRAMRCIERIGRPADRRFVDFVMMACAQLLQIGEFSKMKPYLPRALELARGQNRQDRVCAVLCHMATVSWFEGRYADSREEGERALEIAESLGSLPMIFSAKFILSLAHWGTADMDRALALQYELRETFSGDLETARLGAVAIPGSMVRSHISWFMMEVGRYEEGLPHIEQALEIAKRAGEPYSELLARNGLGRNLMKLKRHRDAAACLEGAVSLIEQFGYDAIRPHVIGQLASALAGVGEAERAVEMVEAWLAQGLEERTGRLELYYLNAGYAEALLRTGRQDKALAAADRALEVARNLSNPCLIVQALGLRARLLAEVQPQAAAIGLDLAEQAELCRRHGLVADA